MRTFGVQRVVRRVLLRAVDVSIQRLASFRTRLDGPGINYSDIGTVTFTIDGRQLADVIVPRIADE